MIAAAPVPEMRRRIDHGQPAATEIPIRQGDLAAVLDAAEAMAAALTGTANESFLTYAERAALARWWELTGVDD